MSDPINQHYVPKVYLKAFTNSQKIIYQVRRKHLKIKPTTISKICYEANYFTIQRDETKILNKISDSFYIEKNVFKKQENQYLKLLKKLSISSLKEFKISKSEARTFLEILTTIKRRNPTVRRILASNYKNYFNSPEFKKEIRPGIELSKQIDKIDPEAYVENMIHELNTDPKRLHDLYLTSFLNKQKRVVETVLDTLMSHPLYIFHAPAGNQFITSDNPGFTIVDDIITNYGGLSEKFQFFFPLTPTLCLLVDGSLQEDPYALDKPIHSEHVNSAVVYAINKSTSIVAMQKIFCYSENLLKNFISTSKEFNS